MVGNTNVGQTSTDAMFKEQIFTSSALTVGAWAGASTAINITVPSGYMILGVLNTQPNGAVVTTFPYDSHLLFGKTGTQTLTAWCFNTWGESQTFSISAIVLFVKK